MPNQASCGSAHPAHHSQCRWFGRPGLKLRMTNERQYLSTVHDGVVCGRFVLNPKNCLPLLLRALGGMHFLPDFLARGHV